MAPQDAPSPTAELLSLKAITQDLLLDTLEPSQRIQIGTRCLDQIPNDDLTGIPLETVERCVAAHAAARRTEAILAFLPQLKGRIKATNHSHQIISQHLASDQMIIPNLIYHSMKTTYLVQTAKGDQKTLVVEATHSTFVIQEDMRCNFQVNMSYTPSDGLDTISARFEHTKDYARHCFNFLQSANVQQLLIALSEDLNMPVTSTPDLKARESAHATVTEERRSKLRLEALAAKVAHGWDRLRSLGPGDVCSYECEECPDINEELRKTLDSFDRPCTKYPLPELETPDASQRDVTFGRLLRGLVPYDFRMGDWEDCSYFPLEFMGSGTGTGDYKHTIEDLVVSIAVAGVDLDRID